MLKKLLKQQLNSSSILSKIILDQIIKKCAITIHNTALFAQENTNLYTANEKKHQKHTRSIQQIVYTEDLSVEENLQLAQQLNQPVEDNGIVFYAQSDLSIQQNQSVRRAQPRYSGYRKIGHKINSCKNRYIQLNQCILIEIS